MNGTRKTLLVGLALALAVGCLWGFESRAGGTIDTNNAHAWAENAGWIHFAPTHGEVTVTARSLSGYAWAENVGWIKLGNSNGGPYANTGPADWGVNVVVGGLSGYAWSENAGWINFHPAHSQVTLDPGTGSFDGYAWAENFGWVHFKNASPAYNVRRTAVFVSGTIITIR